MFTGIIESVGRIDRIETHARSANRSFWVTANLADSLQIDQSVAHDGVCLTVERLAGERYRVTAIAETLQKTRLGDWTGGTRVNLERSLAVGDRLDGHFVQGHTDSTGEIREIVDRSGSYDYIVAYPPEFAGLVVPRGSIALNGISLTVARCHDEDSALQVSIIPYTYEHTNMGDLRPHDRVNIEFDILGKYVTRRETTMRPQTRGSLESHDE